MYLYILRIYKTIVIEDKVMNEREGWGIMNKINYKKIKNFWFGIRTESLIVSEMALNILLLFGTMCVWEVVFSAQTITKIKVLFSSEKH